MTEYSSDFAAYQHALTTRPAHVIECHVPGELHIYYYVGKGDVYVAICDNDRNLCRFIPHLRFQ